MFLSIKEMEVRKVRFDHTFSPGEIDFADAGVKQAGPLHVTGEAELLESTDEIRIKGNLTVVMEAECDRCLAQVRFAIDAAFDLFYQPMAEIAVEEEVAINPGEAEIGFYEGDGLELEDILREQVLLMLPMQRTCRTDCKGICPVCGRNRNEVSCECRTHPGDDRWAALRNL
jgi:uncharacterized protein